MTVPKFSSTSLSTRFRQPKRKLPYLCRSLAVLGIIFLALQYLDILGSLVEFYKAWALNYFHAQFLLQDPNVAWVVPFYEGFPFSLKPSEECQKILQNENFLREIAKANEDDEKAQQDWMVALKACHGPLPEHDHDAMEELTLKNFWKTLESCGKQGGCAGPWRQTIRRNRQLERVFVETARCSLQTEFPLTLQVHDKLPTMRQKKPKNWKPKRILLLSLTLGPDGPNMACKLVSTALTRLWNLTLVEGPWRGRHSKFSDALAALHKLLELEPAIAPEDTLVVFVDSRDILMQQSPQTIVQEYLSQPYEFVFSAEENCSPMDEFPHSVAAEDYMKDHMFPYATALGVRSGPQYVNSGGWIATASAASVVLKELVQFVQRYSKTDPNCLLGGTDQLLGNMVFLRHRAMIGMDANYQMFGGGSWDLIDKELVLQPSSDKTKNKAYCHREHRECPGMLHFSNGKSNSESGTLQVAYEALTSSKAIQKCPVQRWGTLTLVRRTKGTVKTVYQDVHLEKPGHSEWNKCLSGKACFGK